jgi:transcriptional regulator with XRE-family HTH domain
VGYNLLRFVLEPILMGDMPSAPFQPFHTDWRERLEAAMRAKNYKRRSLALAAGLDPGLVSEWLNPNKKKNPQFESMAKVAEVLGVPLDHFVSGKPSSQVAGNVISPVSLSQAEVIGDLNAGHWLEIGVYDVGEIRTVPMIPHPDFMGVRQYAWRVRGSSMDRVVKPGSFVIGVAFYEINKWRPMRDGDIVVCRRQDGDKYELTLKTVAKTEQGYRLDPDSDDPRWQEPVWLSAEDSGEEVTVEATHLVIGKFDFLA